MLGFYADEAKKADALRKFTASKKLHESILANCADLEANALLSFYATWNAIDVRRHPVVQALLTLLDAGGDQTIVFRLRDQFHFVHQNESIQGIWGQYKLGSQNEIGIRGQCLVTGKQDLPIARIHEAKIKGVKDAQPVGANLVSFNVPSFISYEKIQSYNSPISLDAVFGYTTALNHLLASERNSLRNIGDMTVVFWTRGRTFSAADELLKHFMMDAPRTEEQIGDTVQVKHVLDRIRKGDLVSEDMMALPEETTIYVMGLAPNNSRLSIRFFWKGAFGSMMDRLHEHVEDLRLGKTGGSDESTPTLYRLLGETVRHDDKGKFKADDISPTLSGELFRSILFGHAYPFSFYMAIMNRIRSGDRIEAMKAAAIKAYLTRYARIHRINSIKEVLSVSLNKETKDVAYRLGRLFAILEKAQQDAAGGTRLNATIKDRYFGAAASTPGAVFPVLLKLAQHHMAKAEYGGSRDRDIQEILDAVEVFPKRLDLTQQGLFILGYYQQKQEIYTKKSKNEPIKNDEENDTDGN